MLGILRQKHRAMPIIAALMLTMLVWMLPANVSAAEAVKAVYTIDFEGAVEADFTDKNADGVNFTWTTDLTHTLDQFATDYAAASDKKWDVTVEGNKLKFTAKQAGAFGSTGAPTAEPATDVTIAAKGTKATAAKYELDLKDITDANGENALKDRSIDGITITWNTSLATTMSNFVTAYNAANKAYTAAWASNKLTLTAVVKGAFDAENNAENADKTKAPGKEPQLAGGDITISDPGTKAEYTITLTGATEADLATTPKKQIDGVDITWDAAGLDTTMGNFVTAYNNYVPDPNDSEDEAKAYTASYASNVLTLTAKAAGEVTTAPTTTATTGAVKAVYTINLTGKEQAELDTKKIDGVSITWATDLATTMGNFVNSYNDATADPAKAYIASYSTDDTGTSTLTLTAKEAGAVTTAPITDIGGIDVSLTEGVAGANGTSITAANPTQGVAPDATKNKTLSLTGAEGTAPVPAPGAAVTQVTAGANATSSGGSGSGSTTPSTPTTPTTPDNPTGPTTEVKPDGTKVETSTQTQPDGTKVETVTETKPDGTKTETKAETKVDGSKVEQQVVTETNGTTVKTEVITNADGTVQRESEATIQADGSATEVVKETQTNSAGKQVASTTTTKTDAAGKLLSETKTAVIANPAKDTTATVTVKTNAAGTTTAAAAVTKPGNDRKSGTNGIVYASIVKQITEAAGTTNVTIRQKVTDQDGKTTFTVQVNAKDLTAGKKLTIVKLDKKGNPVLVNAKTYPVTAAGNVSVTMNQSGTYQLLNASEAKKVSNAILKTVQAKKTNTSVKKGKKTSMALSSKLNKSNVAKITYSASNKSVVKVSKSGTIAAKKKGTAIVKAKVTLKNGKTKTVQMKVKVK